MDYKRLPYEPLKQFCIKAFQGYGFDSEESEQITDVLLEGTQLLFVGEEDLIRQAFNIKGQENCAFLPKILSRKKQIIPQLTEVLS